MADNTNIEWTDATWNIITGCSLVDEGCRHCYAARLIATWPAIGNHPSRIGLARKNAAGEAKFTGEVRFNADWLDQPLRWKKPRRIFVCAHGDLFHEGVPDDWIDQVFAIMALTPNHTYQVLTKRPERAREYLCRPQMRDRWWEAGDRLHRNAMLPDVNLPTVNLMGDGPLPNVWLGTSISDQASADRRIPHLLATPAAVRFISAEPLLGAVDLRYAFPDFRTACCHKCGFRTNKVGGICPNDGMILRGDIGLDWVIVGGESGPGARPMQDEWAQSIIDQCKGAGVAVFLKQMGGTRKPFRPVPESLMVREWPNE